MDGDREPYPSWIPPGTLPSPRATRSFQVSCGPFGDLLHRDAPGHRAHQLAEVAAHALRLVDPGHAVAGEGADREGDRRAAPGPGACACGGRARSSRPVKMHWCAPSWQADDALLAADARLRVDLRDDLVRRDRGRPTPCTPAPRGPRARARSSSRAGRGTRRGRRSCPPRCGSRRCITAVHTCTLVEPERDELGRVAPGRDAADARDGHAADVVARDARRPCAARWASPPGRSSRRWSTRRRRAGRGPCARGRRP